MATKFDKEMMKKQHFWLLLIPLVIGLILAWIGLFGSVGSATQAKEKENDTAFDAVSKAKAQPKAKLVKYDERKGLLFDRRTVLWEQMWKIQQGMYEWPKSLGEEQLALVKAKKYKFGDEVAETRFLDAFRDHYAKEYDVIAKAAAPLQFAGGWQNVLRYVPKWLRTPESEDVWLALEDFWVQHEVLLALARVNSEAAKFQRPSELPVGHPMKAATDTPRKRTFVSRTWAVEIEIVDEAGGSALRGNIRNLTERLQPFGANNELILNVWLSDNATKPFAFVIEGSSLEGGKSEIVKPLGKRHQVFEGAVRELARVEQVFDVRTAPIKRLDKLVMGYLSARHSQAELQMTAFSKKILDAEAATTTAAGTGTGMGMGGMGMGIGMGMYGGMGTFPGGKGGGLSGQGGTSSKDVTFNGLVRTRYISRTDQVRAMPIGLNLVVDQAYVQDVLTALANCTLRFQTVQSHMSRFRGSVSYVAEQSSGGGRPSGSNMPGMPGRPGAGGTGGGEGDDEAATGGGKGGRNPGGVGPASPFPSGGTSFPGTGGGFRPGAGRGALSSSEDQVAGNLVELSVYGIASLYEQFQKPEPKADGTTTPPAATPPAAPPKDAPPETPAVTPPKDGVPTPPKDGTTPPAPAGDPKAALPVPPKDAPPAPPKDGTVPPKPAGDPKDAPPVPPKN